MKIIICTRDLMFGGAGVYVRGLLKEFDKDEKIEKILVISPEKLKGFNPKIQFDPLPLKGDFFITKELIFALRAKKKIDRLLKREKYDLIYTCHPFLISERFDVPFVAIFHGLHRSYVHTPTKDWRTRISKTFHFLYSYFDYKTIRKADKVVFVSDRTLKEAKKFYSKYMYKFICIPAFIDTSKFYPLSKMEKEKLREKYKLEKNKKYVLYVGRLEPLKGIELLIEVIKELRESIKLELLVVGEGLLLKKIKSYDFVNYLGKIPNEEMNKIYNIADLFILPSYYENCPLTVLEAMASGCLILASDVGDIKNMLDNDNLIFNVKNKDEPETKIIQLSDLKPKEKNKIIQNLIKRVRDNYDVKVISRKILDLGKNVERK